MFTTVTISGHSRPIAVCDNYAKACEIAHNWVKSQRTELVLKRRYETPDGREVRFYYESSLFNSWENPITAHTTVTLTSYILNEVYLEE